MAAAHKQLVHGLVDDSHDRVTQARAGQTLHRILAQHERDDSHHRLPQAHRAGHGASSSNIVSELVFSARRNDRKALEGASATTQGDGTKHIRRRGVIAASASLDSLIGNPVQSLHTSSEQFTEYVHQKSNRVGMPHPNDRRRGVLPQVKDLHKLVAAAEATTAKAHESDHPAVEESSQSKLTRALAKIRGQGAFNQLQAHALPPVGLPAFIGAKNPHMAFMEFRREMDGQQGKRRIHPSVGLQDGNTTTKIPIRFGDQVCLISTVAHVPLAVGADGRSSTAIDTSVGPHMSFTIVDFCNPTRHDEVTMRDSFWLRVNPAALTSVNSESDGNDEEDVASLLVDTNYFLGCPGWLDADSSSKTECTKQPKKRRGDGHDSSKFFRLVAMKADTPSRDYYGDDDATREYALETNEHVFRLARWKISFQQQQAVKLPPAVALVLEQNDVNDALLNCSNIQLAQNSDFVLAYDPHLRRGVCRPLSKRTRQHVKGSDRGDRVRRRCDEDTHTSIWQIRLLHREQRAQDKAGSSGEDGSDSDDPSVKWLRDKQAIIVRNEAKLEGRLQLAQHARSEFEKVAIDSNSKLAQIEKRKSERAPVYFEQLAHTLAISPIASSPKRLNISGSESRLPRLR